MVFKNRTKKCLVFKWHLKTRRKSLIFKWSIIRKTRHKKVQFSDPHCTLFETDFCLLVVKPQQKQDFFKCPDMEYWLIVFKSQAHLENYRVGNNVINGMYTQWGLEHQTCSVFVSELCSCRNGFNKMAEILSKPFQKNKQKRFSFRMIKKQDGHHHKSQLVFMYSKFECSVFVHTQICYLPTRFACCGIKLVGG